MIATGVMNNEELYKALELTIKNGLNSIAIAILALFENDAPLESILQLLMVAKKIELWNAAFKNPILRNEIDSRHLMEILNNLKNEHSLDATESDFVLTIMKTPEWCKMFSYNFFLPFASISVKVAAYIATEPDFLRNLDYTQVTKLIDLIPAQTKLILSSVISFHRKGGLDQLWVEETMKYLIMKSLNAVKIICEDDEFKDVKAMVDQAMHLSLQSLVTTLNESTPEDAGYDDASSPNNPAVQYLTNSMDALSLETSTTSDQPPEKDQEKMNGLKRSRSFYAK